MNDLRKPFQQLAGRFVDATGERPRENNRWPPIVVTKTEIDAEVERLASLAAPADGRREALTTRSWPGTATSGRRAT